MSKLLASLSGLACFVWVSLWSWFITDECEQGKIDNNLPTTSLHISDAEFNFSADDIFSFHQSDAAPVIPGDNLALLQQLAIYLGENPGRELELNGVYALSERNQTPHPNLGIARAKSIEKLLIAEGTPKEQLVTSATSVQNLYLMSGRVLGGVNFIFSELSEEEEQVQNGDAEKPVEEEFPAVAKTDGDGARLLFYTEKKYRLDQANRPFLDSLRRALRKQPSKTVIISGFSQSKEEKEVPGNLAELRAKAVRRYLVDNGLRRRQIVVVSHPGSAKNDDERRVEMKVE